MRDLIFVAGRDPRSEPGGGHSSYVRAHGRTAIRAGFRPHLFCVGPSAETAETAYGVIHRAASVFRPFRQLIVAGHAWPLASAIEAFAAEAAGPQVIHSFGVWGYAGHLAAERLKQRGVRTASIVSSYTTYEDESNSRVRGADFSGALARLRFRAEYLWIRAAVARYERIAYTRADALLVNYESVRRLIDSRYGIGERCLLIPYSSESSLEEGAETTAREIPDAIARLSPPDAPLIVAVSRHDPRKGVDVLLAALRLLRHRGVPFRACLVGEGSMLAAHRSIAARAGFGESVVLTGLVPDTAPYLAAADVFVLPSRREQSGSLALIEALQAGLPVIASGVDGLLEDLRDGTDALLVAPGDAESLALALERLIGDRALREALAAEGRRTFARRFSPDAFGSALVALYAMFGVAPHRG